MSTKAVLRAKTTRSAGIQVDVNHLVKDFPLSDSRAVVRAVNDISFRIEAGTTLGLVGESGSGKSTVGRCLLRLVEPSRGTIHLNDEEITGLSDRKLRQRRRRLQVVFQDPYDALNPRMQIGRLLEEPLKLHSDLNPYERKERIGRLLEAVKLEEDHLGRYPRELSGGQLQRVSIARAIACDPGLIVLDEPTSSLDVSVRAGILDLLAELQDATGVTYLLISHDLGTIAAYCDEVAVMYLGRIVETGPAKSVFQDPQHPYTQVLISSFLPADPNAIVRRYAIRGEVPSPINVPPGCPFASRCPLLREDCNERFPSYVKASAKHLAACVRIPEGSNKLSSDRMSDQ